jgi:hypothetical protein
MTNWPSHTDYQDAIQNPHICFEVPDLKAADVKCDMLGLPRVMSGNFASVYEVKTADGRWAIRCFVRQVMGQQGRYARLSQYLGEINMEWLVKFEYILRGIQVKGEWYPIVKMQWVEGCPINNFVEENVQNPQVMLNLADQVRQLMKDMRVHKLAHGDLQHGNVMATPDGRLRMVDYDGMFAPVFRGKSPELGHINFQHPRRTPETYDEFLDNFSALVFYTSLLALAGEPEIFQKHYTGDNLIFLSADYKNIHASQLFPRLKAHKDPRVQQLSELIRQCCLTEMTRVPNFEDTVVALEQGKFADVLARLGSAGPAAAAAPAAPAVTSWLETPPEPKGSRPAAPAPAPPPPSTPKPAPSFASTYNQPAPASAPAPVPSPSAPAPVHRPPPRPMPTPARPAPAPKAAPRPAAPRKSGKNNQPLIIAVFVILGLIVLLLAILLGRR